MSNMQKTITISREDLNGGKFKNSRVENFGVAPTDRDIKLIAKLLKKYEVRKAVKS